MTDENRARLELVPARPSCTVTHIYPDQLMSIDLRSEMQLHRTLWVCSRIIVEGNEQPAEALYAPWLGRCGIAHGGPAEWTDCETLDHAIELWQLGRMVP